MRSVGLVLLALSLLFAGVAVWGLKSLSGAHAAPPPPSLAVARTTVVVAARPIGFGQPITADALKTQPWPEGAAPPGAFRSVAELTSGSARVALTPIAANEPILPQRISGPGGRGTLSAVIRPGMRASAIRIDDVAGVAGFVLPGDFVDVMITRPEGEQHTMRTDLLLQGVRVLAIDQSADNDKSNPTLAKAATVEVSPAQAQKLALAAQVGTLSLSLRGQEDLLAPKLAAGAMHVGDLRSGETAAPRRGRVRMAHAAGPTVQVFRGADASAVRVRSE